MHVDMVSQTSFWALGDVVVRRMGVGKDKGKKMRSRCKMVARYGQPGGVLTCYLELALYKQALALQGKGSARLWKSLADKAEL